MANLEKKKKTGNPEKKESTECLEKKKNALLRILQILKKYSDSEHPLTQKAIEQYLDDEFGIQIERKAIARNIALLRDAGYEIGTAPARKGCYFDETSRDFTDAELRLLIDGVLSSKYISAGYSKEIINKLCALSNQYFRSHVKHIHSLGEWDKSENQALFYNIELVDEAIERRLQIQFDYNKYGADKKLHKTHTHIVTPYQLVLHNQRYYLMCKSERWQNMGFYRLDRITNMSLTDEKASPITQIPGYERGINYKELSTALPYMYTDKPERIDLVAYESIVDQIIDWFGKDIRIEPCPDDERKVKVSLIASPMAMEHWAMQYILNVEILSPASLRETIKGNVTAAAAAYKEYKGEALTVGETATADLVDELAGREGVEAIRVAPYETYSIEADGKKTEDEGPVVILKVWD